MEHIAERDPLMVELEQLANVRSLPAENDFPDYCLHPENYRGCNSDYIYIENGRGKKCRCAFERDGNREYEAFKELIPVRIRKNGMSFNSKLAYQVPALNKILPAKKNDIYPKPVMGAYIHGETGLGKSHICYYTIGQLMRYSGRRVTAAVIEAKELSRVWEKIHSEDKNKALAQLQHLITVEILFIDECEKFGNMTIDRESEFFYLIKKRHDAMRYTLIASQIGLHEFCQRMPTEQVEYDKHGAGPAERRLREMCQEIHLVKDAQQRIEL